MIGRVFSFFRSGQLGLSIRRFAVFALPAIVIVGAFALTGVMSIFKPKPEEKEDLIKATPVVVAEAVSERVKLSVSAQGEALPKIAIDLTPQVSGKIVFVAPVFIEGGAFDEDDVLMRIEDSEYRYRVVQARANVAQARSRFASEEAEAENARTEWEELGRGEGTPLALREPQLADAAAALASAEAALNEATLQLQRTEVRAPFKGRVETRTVDFGQYVTPGASLGRIFSTDVMEVALPLTDAELGQLGLHVGYRQSAEEPGPNVRLSALVAGTPREWRGRIARTANAYDRETRVLFVYAEVEDPYGAGADNGAPLAAGLFVTADIEGRAIDGGVVVPRSALRGEDEVYIARADDTLEIRRVVVASSDRTKAVLLSGVEPGERVITSPVRGAADGVALAVTGGSEEAGGPVAIAGK